MNAQRPLEGIRQAHQRLWLASCRWGLAAGFVIAVSATWSLSDSCQSPVLITPERINPNTAPMASLVRLPGIGKARAIDILNYRQAADEPVFQSAASLEEIRGIGPKTVEAMSAHLVFE